ncbi:MAG TPA: Lrp/AsnC family transcriptional regulator [Lysobacter sp.]
MNALDAVDKQILAILCDNARISMKDLAGEIGLSAPAAADRVRRLEERGVVRAFTVELDPVAMGYGLQAIVRIRPMPGKLHLVQELITQIPEFVECDKVTGEDCYIARLFVRNIDALDQVLDRIADKAETNTSIVKSQTIKRRPPPFGP